jgi:hypothetical protein
MTAGITKAKVFRVKTGWRGLLVAKPSVTVKQTKHGSRDRVHHLTTWKNTERFNLSDSSFLGRISCLFHCKERVKKKNYFSSHLRSSGLSNRYMIQHNYAVNTLISKQTYLPLFLLMFSSLCKSVGFLVAGAYYRIFQDTLISLRMFETTVV